MLEHKKDAQPIDLEYMTEKSDSVSDTPIFSIYILLDNFQQDLPGGHEHS